MVEAAIAVARDVPLYLDQIGRCAASEAVAIQAEVGGPVTGIHFTDGAFLKRGEKLFTIDPRPYEVAVKQAEATLAERRAVLSRARIQANRYRDLVKANNVSKEAAEEKLSDELVASAQVESALVEVERARLDLDRCTLVSPIEGRAGHRLVDLGKLVKKDGEEPLLRIGRMDPIYAEFSIAESHLPEVRRHMKENPLEVEVTIPEEPGEPIRGKLTFIDNLVDELTGTIKLRATLANPDRRLWPGQFVQVRLILRTLVGAVLVPVPAVQTGAAGLFVYVVSKDSVAEMRTVKVGQDHDDRVVLLEGVAAGETVITNGQLAVMPGGKVKIEEPAPPSPSPGASPSPGGNP